MIVDADVGRAVQARDLAALSALADRGVDLDAVHVPTEAGPRTVLEQTLRTGDVTFVEGVLALPGVSVAGSLPRHGFWSWAAEADADVVRAFVERSATSVDHPDADGRTLLLELAAAGADPALVDWVLERSDGQPAATDGTTAFQQAVVHGHLDVAERLLRAGADPNTGNTHTGWTALVTAVALGRDDVVTWLCGQPGVNPDAADLEGATAVHHAARGAAPPVLRALLAAPGLDARAKDRHGRTPLMEAARHGRAEATAILLTGPDPGVDRVDHDRRTALHHAVLAHSAATVEALLAGARPNLAVTDRPDGLTAREMAVRDGATGIADVLAAHEARFGPQADTPENEPPDTPPPAAPNRPPAVPAIADPPIRLDPS